MSKYHITEAGPKECQASQRACPVGGEHFTTRERAEQAFEQQFPRALTSVRKALSSVNSLPTVSHSVQIKPFAGARYFGCHVDEKALAAHLEAWRSLVGEEKARLMEQNKANRDRGRVYHLTVVAPGEMKKAKEFTPFPTDVTITYRGVGKAIDGEHEAWFVVCESEAISDWRRANKLPEKDLHITLGFDAKDVHTKPKNSGSIVLH